MGCLALTSACITAVHLDLHIGLTGKLKAEGAAQSTSACTACEQPMSLSTSQAALRRSASPVVGSQAAVAYCAVQAAVPASMTARGACRSSALRFCVLICSPRSILQPEPVGAGYALSLLTVSLRLPGSVLPHKVHRRGSSQCSAVMQTSALNRVACHSAVVI